MHTQSKPLSDPRPSVEMSGSSSRPEQSAADDELKRLARVLHDDTLQLLTGVGLQLDALEGDGNLTPEQCNRLRTMHASVVAGQARLRRLVDMLHRPRNVDVILNAGCGASLAGLGPQLSGVWGVQVAISDDSATVLRPDFEEEVCYMVSEGVANAVRHGGASTVQVRLGRESGHLKVLITDDGSGFPVRECVERAVACRAGHTPRSLEARVAVLGGTLNVRSCEAGFGVDIALPLAKRVVAA